MPTFNDTVDIERAYLKAVTSSVMMARTYLHQGKEEMFTSDERKFIFAIATKALNNANSLLTRAVYEYEVGTILDDSISVSFIGEWNIIESVADYDAVESFISKLKEAEAGRKALALSEEIVAMLEGGKIEEAISHLKRESMMMGGMKESRPIVNLKDISARLAAIREKQAHPEKYQGVKIGFKTFDENTGGLFPGELTLIAGITGLGKSTLCRNIAKGIVSCNPTAKNVLHIANEEYLEQVQHKYDALLTGVPYSDFKLAKISDENLDRWQKFMQKGMEEAGMGQVFIKEVPAFTDVSLVEQEFRILENRGIHIHVIIIDHLPHVKPIQKAWGENDERAKAAADCKELARSLRCSVVIPTQAATEVEKKQTQGKRAGKLDVYGSKGQIHVANTFLIITYKGTDDTQTDVEEYKRDVYWLCDAKKNRDGAPFYFIAKHRVRDGLVEEVVDPAKMPTKESKSTADSVIQSAAKIGNAKASAVPAPVPSPAPVDPIPESSLDVPVRLRDESMQFAEEIEGGGDEEGVQSSQISPLEDQLLADAVSAVEGKAIVDPPIAHIPPKGTAVEETKGVPSVGKITLERLRMKKVMLGRV